MPLTDDEFLARLRRDDLTRVCAVQIDYQLESSGAPANDTIYVADVAYVDESTLTPYPAVLNGVPTFSRSLSGDRLGAYQSSLGTIEIDNADGVYDYVLDLALDGSQVRLYFGFTDVDFSDFRLIFVALGTKASCPSADRISIQIKDTGLLLNKSIGGTSTVGGSGPNADKARPLNFGFVQQVEFLVSDPIGLVYVHSDTGDNTVARIVRDRGASVVFTDNGDGTVTLSASPDGQITGDVLALPPGADPSDFSARRVSDAMDTIVGGRAGLIDAGYYAGPHASFVPGDSDDYELGFSIQDQRNVQDFLADLVDSGNCFWAITRIGTFNYGRLRPNDIATLGLTSTNINDDDIDNRSVKLDHLLPQYYRFQAYMDKNWTDASNLAAGLTPDEVATLSRKGLYLMQDAAVGTTYADAPELYDLSMVVSPAIETWLSGDVDAEDLSILAAWMETRRFMFLPWIETLQITVGFEFYELELGDAVNVTMPRFGLDSGALFQVIGINLKPSQAKIDLTLIRRRLSTPYPDGWVRTTTDADADTTSALITDTAVVPIVPPPVIDITIPGASWYPGNLSGSYTGGGILLSFDPWTDAPQPFMLDNFTGSSSQTLATHTPDIGAWTAPPTNAPNSVANADTVGSNPTLADFQLTGNGTFELTDLTGDPTIVLYYTGALSSPDYYMELDIALPDYASAPANYYLYVSINGRMFLDTGANPGFWNSLYPSVVIHKFTNEWTYYASFEWNDFSNPFVLGPNVADSNYDTVPGNYLGVAAQTVTIRVEFFGRRVRMKVNGVVQQIRGLDIVDWTTNNFDAAGKIAWVIYTQNDTGSVSYAKIDRAAAGYLTGQFEQIPIFDAFSDLNGTKLDDSSVGYTAQPWTVNPYFGGGAYGAFVIHSRTTSVTTAYDTYSISDEIARRPKVSEDGTVDNGEMLYTPSGTIGNFKKFKIETEAVFTPDGTTEGYVAVYEDAATSITAAQQLFSVGTSGITIAGVSYSFTPVSGTKYAISLVVDDTDLTLYVNDAKQGETQSWAATPAEPFGLSLKDQNVAGGQGITALSYFRVKTIGGVPADGSATGTSTVSGVGTIGPTGHGVAAGTSTVSGVGAGGSSGGQQLQIPGGDYINQTNTSKQAQVPGSTYINGR